MLLVDLAHPVCVLALFLLKERSKVLGLQTENSLFCFIRVAPNLYNILP